MIRFSTSLFAGSARMSVRRAVATVCAAVAAISGLAAFTASSAEAGWTHTHNFKYSYVMAKTVPYVNSGLVVANLYNDTGVQMVCWTDSQWVYDRNYSNYNSPRWFKVRFGSTGVGYVHSSYVYDQYAVPHC